MSLFTQNNSFYYVPKGISKFILLIFSKMKALLPLNLTRINKKYLFDLLDSHLIVRVCIFSIAIKSRFLLIWGRTNRHADGACLPAHVFLITGGSEAAGTMYFIILVYRVNSKLGVVLTKAR